jgi:hypothetical protein
MKELRGGVNMTCFGACMDLASYMVKKGYLDPDTPASIRDCVEFCG